MRRIVLAQICLLFLCIVVLFLSFCLVCMYVYVLDFVLALRLGADVEQSEEYQEPSSTGHFEQQEHFEEDKYNMNIHITFKYNFIQHFNIVCL